MMENQELEHDNKQIIIDENEIAKRFVRFQRMIVSNFKKIAYMKSYNKTDKAKLSRKKHAKKYKQTPEGRAKIREQMKRYQKSDKFKEWSREYNRRPEVREKRNEYFRNYRKNKPDLGISEHVRKLKRVLKKIDSTILYDVNAPLPQKPHNINQVLSARRIRNLHSNYSELYLFFDYVDKLENYFRGNNHG